jgi:hypothetical protein
MSSSASFCCFLPLPFVASVAAPRGAGAAFFAPEMGAAPSEFWGMPAALRLLPLFPETPDKGVAAPGTPDFPETADSGVDAPTSCLREPPPKDVWEPPMEIWAIFLTVGSAAGALLAGA